MKIKYELDVDKFTKVYNELKVNEEMYACNIDMYGLANKYDKTRDKNLQDIMYAINRNIFVEIDDIDIVKKINNMYDYYDNPNKLTPSEITDCIKEMYGFHVKSTGAFNFNVSDITIVKNNNGSIDIFITVHTYLGTGIAFLESLESFTDKALKRIKDEIYYHNNSYRKYIGCYTNNQQPKSFIGTIKSWFK